MERAGGRNHRARPWLLLVAIVTYVALRGAILTTNFDLVAFTAYEQFPMGTMPALLMDGSGIPIQDFYDNAAGQLLIGVAAIPAYLALGPCYLALKLVPALLGLGVLVLAWVFCDRHLGRRWANLAAFLVALGPTTLVKYSLLASGNHYENLFFSLLAVACFYRLHTGGKRALWLPLAGVTAGLAIFVFLGAILPVGLCVFAHVAARGARGTLRDLRVGLPAWCVGAAPLLYLNLTTGGRGLGFLRGKFVGDAPSASADTAERFPGLFGDGPRHVDSIPQRLSDFFGTHVLDAPSSAGIAGVQGTTFDALLLVAFVAAWCVLLPDTLRFLRNLATGAMDWRPESERTREEERARFLQGFAAPLTLLLPLTGLAFALSDLRIGEDGFAEAFAFTGYRYFNWHLLVASLLILVAAARLAASPGRAPRLAAWALAIVPVLTFLPNFGLPEWSRGFHDDGLRYSGTRYGQIARALLAPRNQHTQDEILEILGGVPLRERRHIYEGLGFCEALRRSRRNADGIAVVPVDEILAEWPDTYAADLSRGMGRFLRTRSAGKLSKVKTRAILAEYPEGSLGHQGLVGGFFQPWKYPLRTHTAGLLAKNCGAFVALESQADRASARGHGLLCGRLVRRGIAEELTRVEEARARVKPVRRQEFHYGLGFGAALEGADESLPPQLLAPLGKPRDRRYTLMGYGAGLLHMEGPADLEARIEALASMLTDEDRRDLRLGAQLEAWTASF